MSKTKVLGERYELIDRLGSGGFADVYKAIDIGKSVEVAIKVLRDRFSDDEKAVKRFQREAEKMMSLDHENVLRVFDHGFDSERGEYFYIMELIENLKTSEEISSDFSQEDKIKIVLQALSGLQYIHENDLIHRDVKPDNLLTFLVNPFEFGMKHSGQSMEEGGVILTKVSDLGLAKHLGLSAMTASNIKFGSGGYTSPEQWKDPREVDHRADIYGLGASLYFFVTGEAPYSEERDIYGVVDKMRQKISPKSPREINQDIPSDLEEAIMTAMAADKEERYQTLDEFKEVLLEFTKKPQESQTATLYNVSSQEEENIFGYNPSQGNESQFNPNWTPEEREQIRRGAIIGKAGILEKVGFVVLLASTLGIGYALYSSNSKEEIETPVKEPSKARIIHRIKKYGIKKDFNGNDIPDLYLPGRGVLMDGKWYMEDNEYVKILARDKNTRWKK